MINIKTYLVPKKNVNNSTVSRSSVTPAAVNNFINDWFYYDVENNAIGCRYDFYSVGGVSANGAGDLQADADALKVTLYYNATDGVLATSTYSITFNEDMSQFKYLRCYFRPSLNNASDNDAIPSATLEVNLNNEARTQSGEYAGSVSVGYINNDSRYASYAVMVSSDKTQFRVVRQTSLYGTTGTNISNAAHGIYCYKIEGVKDL